MRHHKGTGIEAAKPCPDLKQQVKYVGGHRHCAHMKERFMLS